MTNKSNLTLTLSEEALQALMPKFWVYVIQGFMLALVNFLILAAILRFKMLRQKKEYIIIAALAFTDAVNGLACLMAGLVRNIWIMQGTANELYSRWGCISVPWNWFWLFWEHSYGVVLCLVSVDRLIAVSFPLWYFKAGTGYALTLVGGVHLALAINICVSLFFSYPHQTPERPRICYSDWMYDPTYYPWPGNLTLVTSAASIVIYALVVLIFRGKKKVNPGGEQRAQAKSQLKASRRLTVTLGISCFFTFLFHSFPQMLKNVLIGYMGESTSVMSLIVPYVYIIQNFNPLMNFFLYTARHRDMKLAVKCLITCKRLTHAMLGQAQTSQSTHAGTKTAQTAHH